MRKILIYLILSFLLLAACSTEKLPKVSSSHPLAITVNIKDPSLTFIDMETSEKIADWDLDKPYVGGLMHSDGDTLLLYGKQVDSVDLYSLKEGKMIDSWSTGKGIVSGLLLGSQEQIAFADQEKNAVRFFSLTGEELEQVQTRKNPITLLEAQNGRLFVISYNSQNLAVIDLEKKKIIEDFSTHPSASGALLREGKNQIWVGGHGEGAEIEKDIHVYDTETGDLVKKIPAPLMPVSFAESGPYIYSLSHGSNTLYKLDEAGNIINSLKVGANPFAMKISTDALIIAGYDSDDVHIIDPISLQIEEQIPVGKGPFQLILRERMSDGEDSRANHR